uniref:Uncharacterized protein n=1 Tax=viral metagenome TaxID=1070528 RepID=A0A6C0E2D9_9ZZZZ
MSFIMRENHFNFLSETLNEMFGSTFFKGEQKN